VRRRNLAYLLFTAAYCSLLVLAVLLATAWVLARP